MKSNLSGKIVNTKCPACSGPIQFTLGQVGGSILCPGCGKRINLTGDSVGKIERGISETVEKTFK